MKKSRPRMVTPLPTYTRCPHECPDSERCEQCGLCEECHGIKLGRQIGVLLIGVLATVAVMLMWVWARG